VIASYLDKRWSSRPPARRLQTELQQSRVVAVEKQMNQPAWPALPLPAWQDTYATLHMWTQVVGKVCVELTPLVNHCWNSALHVTARGLRTPTMFCNGRFFDIEFDFVDHCLRVQCNDGTAGTLGLAPRSVADFYQELMWTLGRLGLPVSIWPVPVEVPAPIPFLEDHIHVAYDPEYARRFWLILLQTARVLQVFRSRFVGKCSPVHFFWGSFDLAVTRFSGRRAPEREGADRLTREAYSHEVISHGFWPGTRPSEGLAAATTFDEPAFYAYAAPEPPDLDVARVRPAGAFYSAGLKEFILPYDDVRNAAMPDAELMAFLDSTYGAAATLGGWDRAELERDYAGGS
jgi:hypothetical protein